MRAMMLLALLAAGCLPAPEEKKEAEPPTVKRYECRRATGRIRIDGKLDEAAWKEAVVTTDFAVFWQKRKAKTRTQAALLWDDSFLYFGASMDDEDLFALERRANGMTWEDDVFELFFKPSEDKLGYYEFQVNALGTQLELFLPSRGAGGYRRFAAAGRLGMESAVRLDGTLNKLGDKDKGWTVEGRIPWKAFNGTGGGPEPKEKWRFALCRYDYSAAHDAPELSSTAPLTRMDFHRYEDYGELVFMPDKE
ncbi:MAG: carbohydrate-binding family 9-like protein [Gemmataceae bacterium]|nr:carbohydrate-binding family 9-like protein [Gemmataceae bacterium]